MEPWVWSVLLMILGLLLVFLEIFLPSGGILGFLSIASIVASIGMAFYHYPDRPWVGGSLLVSSLIGLPVCAALALKWFPDTPIGRRFLLRVPKEEDVLPDSEERRAIKALIDKIGKAKSPMLPSGAVEIEGFTIDAVSEGMPIDAGQSVRVVEVHGNLVVVRPTDEEPAPSPQGTDDVLSQPIERLGIEDLEDPLG